MIGRNPLNVSYYNPLGRSVKPRADDKMRFAAIQELVSKRNELLATNDGAGVAALEERLSRLGATAEEILEAQPEIAR